MSILPHSHGAAAVTDWRRLTPDELETWRNNLARLRQDPQAAIIN